MSTSSKDVYLVVGGSGFLGRHIVKALKARGDEVSVFDIVQRHDDVPFYVGDISEPGVFSSAVEKVGAYSILIASYLTAVASHRAAPHASYTPRHRCLA
jgi:sterol-4alpha-carboxylate 3-dehydrogenase (decarboxylating)